MINYNTPKPNEICMTQKQTRKLLKFIFGSDLDFYEEHIIHLDDNEQEIFFRTHSEFMSKYPVARDNIQLLKDKRFRDILRRFDMYEGIIERKGL